MAEHIDTVVIGAGQAGLSTSYYLTQRGCEHVVFERQRIGESWRSGKWDSFTLVTPNWTLKLPDFSYAGDDPDGFLLRDQVVRYLEDFATKFNPPIRTGITVTTVANSDDGFVIETDAGAFHAVNVVAAVGLFQKPRLPAYSSRIAPHIMQVHSSRYRNPHQLPEGAVLIVGAGQSGCQIADELRRVGRTVYVCTGRATRLPRHYRGKDVFKWAEQMGVLDQPVTKLPSPAARFVANPQLTGRDGGRSLDLHLLARDGVILLGRLQDANGTSLTIGDDLIENIAQADKFVEEFASAIDGLIAEAGIEAPPDDQPPLRAAYDCAIIRSLDLDSTGITSIVWANGYSFDFSWIKFPIFDEFGYPVQDRGVTTQPGLYFVGLPWLTVAKSGLFAGVGDDAAYVVEHLAGRN